MSALLIDIEEHENASSIMGKAEKSMQALREVREQLTNAEYHSRPELSASQVKEILKNPNRFAMGIKKEQTDAMNLGSAVHKLLLEAHDFDNEFAISPVFDKRTKVGKEGAEIFAQTVKGRTVINEDQYAQAKTMAGIAQEIAGRFFDGGVAEASFFGVLEGIGVRCRPDYYIESAGLVVDIKTTGDASIDEFTRSVANFGYHIQQAFYVDLLRSLGKPVNQFVFVAIQTNGNGIGIYDITPEDEQLGRDLYKKAIERFKRIDEYKTPLYKADNGDAIQTITLPAWAHYKLGA